MSKLKSFFAGVASVLLALLAFLLMRPRRKPLTQEAQKAVDKLEDIKAREAINAKFHNMSDADVVLDYIAEKERERGKNSKPE